MRSFPPRSLRPLLLALFIAVPAAAAGQDVDSLAPAPGDTLEPAPSLEPAPDPRLTWLGDTLGAADSLQPKFSAVPEVWPDSLVDPYVAPRPGARPAWELTGEALLGRGAYSLLDVIESEALILGNDLGGGGMPAFLGGGSGTYANVQTVIDGVPVGNPLETAWDLRRIPVEAIARVAFYPGAGVAAWGGDGTGGVLVITTRRALAATSRSALSFHLGSFDAQGFSGYFGRRIGRRGDVFVAANFDDTEGFDRGDYTRNQLVLKTGWRFGDRHMVELARFSDGLTGSANRGTILGEEDRDATFLHAFYRGSYGPVTARLHGYRDEHDVTESFEFSPVTDPVVLLPGVIGISERSGARGELTLEWEGLTAWASGARESTRVESSHAAFDSPDGGSVLDPAPEDDPDAVRIANPRERTEWGGGIGWERPGVPVTGHVTARSTDPGANADTAVAWRAEIAARPLPTLTFRASAGSAERPAGFVGQAALAGLQASDTEVHPGAPADPAALETWSDWRVEASWSQPGFRLTGRAFAADGTGAFLWSPPSAGLYFDRGRADAFLLGDIPFNAFDALDVMVSGLEAEAVVPLPLWGIQGRAGVRRIEATEEFSDLALPYVPELQALGQLRWADRFFPSRDLLVEARLTGRYLGERTTVRSDELLPSFLVTDLLVQATIINFTISVSYKNLFGTGNRTEPTFFLPPREGFLSIVWRFRE